MLFATMKLPNRAWALLLPVAFLLWGGPRALLALGSVVVLVLLTLIPKFSIGVEVRGDPNPNSVISCCLSIDDLFLGLRTDTSFPYIQVLQCKDSLLILEHMQMSALSVIPDDPLNICTWSSQALFWCADYF